MPTTRRYRTGLVHMGDEGAPARHLCGAGWRAHLARGADWREIAERTVGHTTVGGQTIDLEAPSWKQAQRALTLITASMDLSSGDPPLYDPDELIAHNDHDPVCAERTRHGFPEGHHTLSTPNIWRACEIAAVASRKMATHYAVIKYQFSHWCFGTMSIDLDPTHGSFIPLSPFPAVHVRMAHAIVAGHSLLEDLGLELRASAARPSRINGQWNPIVKQDLEGRLASAGVDLSEHLLWTTRGPRRRLDGRRQIPPAGNKYRWSRRWIRDVPVSVVDAIAYVDWLRDKAASHSVKDITQSLSPYDVTNAQHLARRVLLEVLGFWRRPE
jgi:hypothetical protein